MGWERLRLWSFLTTWQPTVGLRHQPKIKHYAILFLCKQVLKTGVDWVENIKWSKKPKKITIVYTVDEVKRVFLLLDGECNTIGNLLYGAGLRLMECLRLRVKDIDFGYKQINVRSGKGDKDRVTILPHRIKDELSKTIDEVKLIHERDLAEGFGSLYLPNALARKYPNASREFGWQYLFPTSNRSFGRRSSSIRRHHLGKDVFPRKMRKAVIQAGISKK